MTATRWWWIRHAPVVGHDGRLYGSLDVDCDCSDEPRFRALAARLPADAVWVVTPLKRTRATATAIARHHPAAPDAFHVEPLLAEQNFGAWQGLTYADLDAAAGDSHRGAAWRRFWLAPAEAVPPGGESFAAMSARVARAIEDLTRRHAGRDIVCVSHGGPIRAALAHALAVGPEQALRFSVDTCSLTRLEHFAEENAPPGERLGGAWRIAGVNLSAQLPT
ncbi:MAG: histidine phosphatase family protein [Kiloniellaceae bacterium]